MFTTPRNQIEVERFDHEEMTSIDTLFEICDAEFNSCFEAHNTWAVATKPADWMTDFLIPQIKLIAIRDNIYCTDYITECVARTIACMWFGCSNFSETA